MLTEKWSWPEATDLSMSSPNDLLHIIYFLQLGLERDMQMGYQ